MPILVDWNHPDFQSRFLNLEKQEILQVLKTVRKLLQMEWEQVYQDKGLNWEYVSQSNLYSLRASQKMRILAHRDGEWMRLLSIHPDHDSAYE